MSVPNQKIVQIAPRIKRDANNLFAMINIDALQFAVQELNGSALKMWLYFSKNQDRFKFELSQKACQNWGIKKDSYYNGLDELIKKGFLAPAYEDSNIYVFYENPKIRQTEKPMYFSETKKPISETYTQQSENPQRNNTNNTEIKQNKTPFSFRIEGKKYNFSDGSLEEQFKNSDDESDERFGDMPKHKRDELNAECS